MSNPTNIQLEHPFENEGREITSISLRRIRVADLDKIEAMAGAHARAKALIPVLSDLSPEDVAELDAADFYTVMDEIEALMTSPKKLALQAQMLEKIENDA